jgi:hypothetical protein
MNCRKNQQGVVLVIAMIALVAISLAGVALMRTVDTSNVVSGNIAFNEAAIQIADIGAELAYTQVNANLYYDHTTNADGSLVTYHNDPANPGNITGYVLNPNTGCESQTNCPNHYYMTLQSNPQNWYSVQANQVSPALPSGYSLQYRIERMCALTGPATFKDASGNENCRALPIYTAGILQTNPLVDPTTLVSSFAGKLFYRITVKVTGPKDTTAQAQYFYGIQDYIQ